MKTKGEYLLSKSTFVRGLQCKKSLYLHLHYNKFRNPPDEDTQRIFQRGNEVGLVAQQLFPGGVSTSSNKQFDPLQAFQKTRQLLQSNAKIIYEAAFIYDGVLAIADIIVNKRNKWHVFEVKSTTSIKEMNLLDASIQYYVLHGAGLNIENISIVFLNKNYVRKGKLEPSKLFSVQSVLEEVTLKQKTISASLTEMKDVIAKSAIPKIDIGPHCSKPYDCDFTNYCWKHIPKDSIFDLSSIRLTKAFKLYKEGIITINDIKNIKSFSAAQQIQILGVQKKQAHIDKVTIKRFLKSLKYPLYFLDFESFMPAIPLYNNSRPYQQIVFQCSLHLKKTIDSVVIHQGEFLAIPELDMREDLIKFLLKAMGEKGDILVYNSAFEVSRLKELAQDFPQYKKGIENLILRIKDLMGPFRQKAYYHPKMKGSYSIKYVLPALVPYLSYKKLAINNGGLAMSAYEQLLHETNMNKINRMRENLLQYCEMDTLAMVKVVEGLENL